MKRLLFAALLTTTLFSGCSRNYRDTSLYQRTGQVKPIVTVMPVIDNTGVNHLTWDFSREMTDEIRKRIFDSTKLYLLREGGSIEFAKELNDPNPMSLPLDVREQLGAAEFVIVSEFIDQHETPYGLQRPGHEQTGSVISLAMRVRVIDLRKDKPKVVLQEIIDHDHLVAKPYLKTDYTRYPWGTEVYESTPYGLAHSRVVRELVAHVENYIVAAH